MADRNEDYFLPLEDQRVFGAGIKRKRIDFVPASTADVSATTTLPSTRPSRSSVADRYLSIVLPSPTKPSKSTGDEHAVEPPRPNPVGDLCTICKRRQPSPNHESTIAHQVCLEHSHPPSHLDRSRHGLRYLSSYGWDPDERVGLGARADGIRYPIQPVPKHNTVGLHETVDLEAVASRLKTTKRTEHRKRDKHATMNAKEVRMQEKALKKKAERLRRIFYNSDEIERYLGAG